LVKPLRPCRRGRGRAVEPRHGYCMHLPGLAFAYARGRCATLCSRTRIP
jgi:hypothetical protein